MVHLNLSYDGDTQSSSWAYYFLLERNQNLSSSYMGLLMSVNITKVSLIIHEWTCKYNTSYLFTMNKHLS